MEVEHRIGISFTSFEEGTLYSIYIEVASPFLLFTSSSCP